MLLNTRSLKSWPVRLDLPGHDVACHQLHASTGTMRHSATSVRGRVKSAHADSNGSTVTSTNGKEIIMVNFLNSELSTHAAPGEDFLAVFQRAGVSVTLGCCSGSCGVCEMEITQHDGSESSTSVIRTCIAKVPAGCSRLDISELEDEIWGS